ncbi:MAG: translation elongation factor Ts [Patescibacteria group bacterium]|nr:translation elongation factor Ts [Patescibacteria group bacterium]
MKTSVEEIKKLREETQASIADCRKALEESKDYKGAIAWLRKHGIEKAEKKAERKTGAGLVGSYIHQNGKVGVLISILCETDFVARTDEFKNLAHEIAMQIAAMEPKNVEALLKQEYIRDNSRTIHDLIKEMISKFGENIVIKEFCRFEI